MNTTDILAQKLSLLTNSSSEFRALLDTIAPRHRSPLIEKLARHKILYNFSLKCEKLHINEFDDSIAKYAIPKQALVFFKDIDLPVIQSCSQYNHFIRTRNIELLEEAYRLLTDFPNALLLKGSAIQHYVPNYNRYQNDVDLYLSYTDSIRS